jgi:hypothetical protein
LYAALIAAGIVLPAAAHAQWVVANQRLESADASAAIARITNEEGYTLDIYKDGVGAVRGRFSIYDGLAGFAEKSCPTFQIDKQAPGNRSINDAPCLSTKRWTEYILGYVVDGKLKSTYVHSLLNGNSIVFRYRLSAGDYRETEFSLLGSKRSIMTAIGPEVVVGIR